MQEQQTVWVNGMVVHLMSYSIAKQQSSPSLLPASPFRASARGFRMVGFMFIQFRAWAGFSGLGT